MNQYRMVKKAYSDLEPTENSFIYMNSFCIFKDIFNIKRCFHLILNDIFLGFDYGLNDKKMKYNNIMVLYSHNLGKLMNYILSYVMFYILNKLIKNLTIYNYLTIYVYLKTKKIRNTKTLKNILSKWLFNEIKNKIFVHYTNIRNYIHDNEHLKICFLYFILTSINIYFLFLIFQTI